jgi:soluble lytic murein transglycosylase-like protein
MASPYDSKHNAIRAKITQYANKYGIKPSIAIAQIWQESRFNPKARSPVGAAGIAQFMPGTAREYRVNVNDVDSSLDGYGRFMKKLLAMFKGDYPKALAGYNAGPGRVQKAGGVPRIKETQTYVRNIMAMAEKNDNTVANVSETTTTGNTIVSTGNNQSGTGFLNLIITILGITLAVLLLI